ncbi:MAG: insulinase family protein [Ruminococcus sp.]|nr:insulinase family protein [Ruminococcus sp.]
MEILKREQIGNNMFFNTVNDSRFKTMKMSVSAYLPLKKETASQNALLCDILTRSCKEYNTLAILEKKLLSLYGASLSSYVKKEGDLQVLTIAVSGLDDRYAFDDTKISSELAEILCKIIFEPNVLNDEFTQRDFKQSLRQLLDTIDSDFNEKRVYAVSRCVEIMNANSPAGIKRYGDKESAEKVTAKDLYSAWQNLLKTARFEIMYVGEGDSPSALNIFKNKFESIERNPEKLCTETFKSVGNVKEVIEEMELSQSKLVMGFETGVSADDDNYYAMMLLSAILGGTPSAKLFTNVREKQSLCYYCISRYYRRKGYIIVESGVEGENLEKAKNAILNEVNELTSGNITDFEIESAKLAMINGYKSITDTVTGIETWYLTRILDNKVDTPEETAKKINVITKDQLLELAKNIKLDTVYMLKNKD